MFKKRIKFTSFQQEATPKIWIKWDKIKQVELCSVNLGLQVICVWMGWRCPDLIAILVTWGWAVVVSELWTPWGPSIWHGSQKREEGLWGKKGVIRGFRKVNFWLDPKRNFTLNVQWVLVKQWDSHTISQAEAKGLSVYVKHLQITETSSTASVGKWHIDWSLSTLPLSGPSLLSYPCPGPVWPWQ